MKIIINRTGHKISLPVMGRIADAFEAIKAHGFDGVNVLDVKNSEGIQWESIEFNRLFVKDGTFYRFNKWLGEYPYKAVEIEEIGRIKEG